MKEPRILFPSADIADRRLQAVRSKPTSWQDAMKLALTLGGKEVIHDDK